MKNRIIKNASWIILCRIAQAILGLIISMLSARYLGPGNFGTINYASSVVAFVVPIMQLGVNSILVREIVNDPDNEGSTIGTSLIICLLSAVMCIVGVFAFASIANAGEIETIIVCSLYSITLIFQATEQIQYWFQAKYLSKYTSIVSLIVYVFISAYKIYLLASGKSIYWFAVSNALDYMCVSVSLLFIYKKVGGQKLQFNKSIAYRLISNGKYYILSGLMVVVFAQTDKIMLKIMISSSETGYYSAAVACVSMVSFVFSAIIDSFRPTILENKLDNNDKYEKSVIYLYSIIIYMAIALSLFETVFAPLIVNVIYGSQYANSIGILRIIVWYSTFAYYGGAKDVWILAEEKQNYLIILNLSGAIANVILNLILIPVMGAKGAAIASLTTQFFTNVVMGFVIKELRPNNYLMLKALNPLRLIEIFELIKK